MAKYELVRTTINVGGEVEHHMKLDAEHSVVLTYKTAQTEETLDQKCDEILAEEQAEADKQAAIDKAIAEAFMTEEEKANVG